MEHRFIISGLPRSGTAWIATFLNSLPGVFCWHESVQWGDEFDSYTDTFMLPYEHVGDSTTDTSEQFDVMRATRVWIQRNPDDCKACFRSKMGPAVDEYWDKILEMGERWKRQHNPPVVIFEKLFSEDKEEAFIEACRLVRFCTGKDLDRNKFLNHSRLNIQIHGLNETYYNGKRIITNLYP